MEILTLGEKVKAKRKEMNMTLKELAEDRVTPGQISLVESGKSKPSIDLLEYIAEKLNTDIEYFLETEEKQATRICEFYANIAEAAVNAENALRAKEAIEKGIHYAEKYKLTYYIGKFNLAFANLKFINRELEEAQQYCISANSIFLKTESLEDIIKSFILLGTITLEMGYISTSLNYFMQADSILNEYNLMDEVLKAKIFYNIAICQSKMGNMTQAIDYALLVQDRLKLLDNKREYAETLMILSIAYSQDNKVKEALKYAREARKIFDGINDVHEIASIETNIGVIFAKSNNMEESFIHLDKALKLKHDINDDTIPDTMLIICDNHMQLGEYDKALEIVSTIMDELDYEQHLYRIKCFEYQFEIYGKMNDLKKAEETLLNAIKYLETLDFKKQLGDFYVLTGKFYTEIGEKDLALKFINLGLDMYKNLGIILND